MNKVMKFIIKMVLGVIISLLAFSTKVVAEAPTYKRGTPIEEMKLWAEIYKIDYEVLYNVAMCESSLNPDAINYDDPNGGSFGIYQYQITTWEYFNKKYNENLSINDYSHQIKLTAIAISDGKGYHWTCYRKIYK